MRSRKGAWILFLPLLAALVSTGIVAHQHSRRDRLRAELKSQTRELQRLAALLPQKYRPKRTQTASESHDHHDGDGHNH